MQALSCRENEVISCFSKGMSISETAELLFVSKETVRSHRKNIYRKLRITSAIQFGMWIERHLVRGSIKIA